MLSISENNRRWLAVLLAVALLILSLLAIALIVKDRKLNELERQRQLVQEKHQNEQKILETSAQLFGPGFKTKMLKSEDYGEYQKLELSVSNEAGMSPTPGAKATLFYKDGQRQVAPISFIEERARELSQDLPGAKLVKTAYFKDFKGLNGDLKKGIDSFVVTMETDVATGTYSVMYSAPPKYQLMVFDEYANLLFRSLSDKIYE